MRAVVALAALATACKNDTPPPANKTTPAIAIFVDDARVGSVPLEQVLRWPRVDTLVPPAARRLGTWQRIHLATSGAPTDVQQPSATYRDLVPVVYPGDGGAPAFGMFDPVTLAHHGAPAFAVNGITEIRIALAQGSGRGENEHGESEDRDAPPLALAIQSPAGEQVLSAEKLLAIPREAAPGSDEAKGWKLSKVLAAAGVTRYERLLLTDAKGTNLTLEKQDLDEVVAVPFVKLNRQGTLRFRVLRKQGETWQSTGDLRGLVRIEVLR